MNGPPKNRDPKLEGPARLLGGHATGNLSEAEKEALYSAAIDDQNLFDALMEEEALKDLLEQPGVKRELIEALQPKETAWSRFRKWFTTPVAWGTLGAAATAAVLLVVVATRQATQPLGEQRTVAKFEDKVAAPETPPPATPAPVASAPAPKQNEDLPAVAAVRKETEEAAAAVAERDAIPPPAAAPAPKPEPVAVAMAPPPPAPKRILLSESKSAEQPAQVIEYMLLKRSAQGEYEPAATFKASDAVRIRVTAHDNGYLTLTRGPGTSPIVNALPVMSGQTLMVPSTGFLSPSTQAYQLAFTRASAPGAPGAPGSVVGGFRQRAAETVSDEARKVQPTVFDILIRPEGN